jgi:hypothetical protein
VRKQLGRYYVLVCNEDGETELGTGGIGQESSHMSAPFIFYSITVPSSRALASSLLVSA